MLDCNIANVETIAFLNSMTPKWSGYKIKFFAVGNISDKSIQNIAILVLYLNLIGES